VESGEGIESGYQLFVSINIFGIMWNPVKELKDEWRFRYMRLEDYSGIR